MLPLTQILIHSSFISILIFFIIIIYIFFSSFFLFIIKLKGSKIGYDKLDVHNTFLNRSLREVVYIEQPTSFVDLILATHVCRFHKSFYDLKQAPQSWYTRLNDFFFFLLAFGLPRLIPSSLFYLWIVISVIFLSMLMIFYSLVITLFLFNVSLLCWAQSLNFMIWVMLIIF